MTASRLGETFLETVIQTQSVAIGDGSKTTFCSGPTFCANVGVSWSSLVQCRINDRSAVGWGFDQWDNADDSRDDRSCARISCRAGHGAHRRNGPYHRLAHSGRLRLTGCTLTAWNSWISSRHGRSAPARQSRLKRCAPDPAGGTYGLPAAAAFPANTIQQLGTLPFASGIGGAQLRRGGDIQDPRERDCRLSGHFDDFRL